jgi:hypothetical protein
VGRYLYFVKNMLLHLQSWIMTVPEQAWIYKEIMRKMPVAPREKGLFFDPVGRNG